MPSTLPTDPAQFRRAITVPATDPTYPDRWAAWFRDYREHHAGTCDHLVDELAALVDQNVLRRIVDELAVLDPWVACPTTEPVVVPLRSLDGQYPSWLVYLPSTRDGAAGSDAPYDTNTYRLDLVTGRTLRSEEQWPGGHHGAAGVDRARGCVPWWPAVPPDHLSITAAWWDIIELLTFDPRELGLWARTLTLVRNRHAGALAQLDTLTGQASATRRIRQRIRGQRDRLATWADRLAPIGPQIIAAYVGRVDLIKDAINATITPRKGSPLMPGLTTPAAVTTLAQQIHDAITAGTGGRLQVGKQEQAFAWAGVPRTLISQVTTAPTDGRHITTVSVKESPTPAAPVAEGAAKPNVVVFTPGSEDLVKYAGTAEITTEAAHFVRNIETATSTVLTSSILRAIEADTVTEVLAQAGVTVAAAADLSAGILQAIADIAVNGGTASFVGLAPSDWVALVGGLTDAPLANAYTLFGLAPVLVPTLTAGTAVVADGNGVTVWEVEGAPLVTVDPYSKSAINKINIVLETWAAPDVTSAGVVAKVTVGP